MCDRIPPSFLPFEEARQKGAFTRASWSETELVARNSPIPPSPRTGVSSGDIIPAMDGSGASASTQTPPVPIDESGLVAALQATLHSTDEALGNTRTTVTELSLVLEQEADTLAFLQAERSVHGSKSGSSMPRPRKIKTGIKNTSKVKSKSRVKAAMVPTSTANTLHHAELSANNQTLLSLNWVFDGAFSHVQGGRASRVSRASARAPPSNPSSSSLSSSNSTASTTRRRYSEESTDPSTGTPSPPSSSSGCSHGGASDSDYVPR